MSLVLFNVQVKVFLSLLLAGGRTWVSGKCRGTNWIVTDCPNKAEDETFEGNPWCQAANVEPVDRGSNWICWERMLLHDKPKLVYPLQRTHCRPLVSNAWRCSPVSGVSPGLISCLSAAISAFAVAALVLPGNYPYYLDLIGSLSIGPCLIGMAKFGIAFPASYHTYNGVRHLVSFISGCIVAIYSHV